MLPDRYTEDGKFIFEMFEGVSQDIPGIIR